MDPLLQPLQIKQLVLRNRITSTSHVSAPDVGGMPVERYHEEKAKSGTALAMFEPQRIGDAVTSSSVHAAIYDAARLCMAL